MVETVNNHVLFPNPADWSQKPRWQRQWETGVADAVTKAESRTGFRANGRVALTFLISEPTTPGRSRLDDRIRAAKKAGLACAPHHGRGCVLMNDASADSVAVSNGWPWAVGDYCFFRDGARHEIRQLTSVALDAGVWTLGFEEALEYEYPHGAFVWPLLFGLFTCNDMEIANHVVGALQITITENVAARAAQIGAVEPVAADEFAMFKT